MSGKTFCDTNLWFYAFVQGESAKEIAKTRASSDFIRKTDQLVLSTQVVNELCVNLIKKAGFGESNIRSLIDGLHKQYEVAVITHKTIIDASTLREENKLSYWDSLIVASALEQGCSVLCSEDMQHGQIFESSLEVVNPLRRPSD